MIQIENIKMYTVKELHQATGIAMETYRRWIREGRMPAKKVGRMWFVSEETVRQFFGDKEEQGR